MALEYLSTRDQNRFRLDGCGKTMKAVITTDNGGYDRLVYRDVPVPVLAPGEVLLQVLAAGVNNTEINTRLGWYSSVVTGGTNETAGGEQDLETPDGGWNEATPFPFIQGTDCCGRIAAVGPGGDENSMGLRVLVRPCMRPSGFDSLETIWLGSDFDGAFAQYMKVPASEVFPVDCDWSDAELGSIPCAYGTAENMIQRAKVTNNDHVLVAGASGGVGSAVVQLAKRRGAFVTAIAGKTKKEQLLSIGADRVVCRGDGPLAISDEKFVDVMIDNVAGPSFPKIFGILKRGGRYVTSGAIAGPMVELDMRTLYLNDITMIGCTAWDQHVFPDLISYIERGELRPLVAQTFPLERIADAQRVFIEKNHFGKLVLIPSGVSQDPRMK